MAKSVFDMNEYLWGQQKIECYWFHCTSDTPEVYKCGLCDFKSDLKVSLTQHVLVVHQGREDNSVIPRILECHKCKKCSFDTRSLLVLTKHALICHQELQRKKRDRVKPRVVKTHQKSEDDGTSSKKLQQLDLSMLKFKLGSLLKRVINLNSCDEEESRFKCEKYSYKAKEMISLKTHIINKHTHWYECYKCSYKTKRKQSLKWHNLCKHTQPEEVNWHECDKCSFKTVMKPNLRRHVLCVHTDPKDWKWFQCKECSQEFRVRTSLRQHIRRQHEV